MTLVSVPPRDPRAGMAVAGAVLLFSLCLPAAAQETAVEQLENRLRERDARISALEQRVLELERRVGAAAAAPRRAAPTAPVPAAPAVPGAQEPAAPGYLEVDEVLAERALEQALTVEGALLVPEGTIQVEPSFTYTRRETDIGGLFSVGGSVIGGTQRVARNEFRSEVDVRLGLPYSSQIEIGLPYNIVDETVTDDTAIGVLSERSRTGHGIGDFRVGAAKTILREEGWVPDVIGRVTYDSGFGDSSDNGVSLAGGFHELRGSVTALKRQDPMVFVGTASYERAFEDDGVKPGDEVGFTLQAFLATSPNTSLSVGLQQTFAGELKRNGVEVAGSDQVQSAALLGVTTVLGRGVSLNVQGGIGLTEDSPEYFVGISLPIWFDTPIF